MKTNMNNGVYGQVDNALPEQMFKKLQTQIMSPEIAWFWTRTYESKNDPSENFHNHWAHVITKENGVKNSFLADIVEAALLVALDKSGQRLDQLIRSRIGMSTITSNRLTHSPHVDVELPHRTALLYINDCEAPTILYDQSYDMFSGKSGQDFYENTLNANLTVAAESIPVANKFVWFDGLRYHSSTTSTLVPRRIVINFNYTAFDI
jgi:hypothetical protein